MEIKPSQAFPRAVVEQLLANIPFYKAVKQQDMAQFELLLQRAQIIRYSPGETVLRQGEIDNWLYFLLKGRLQVYPGAETGGTPINVITPGEVFGDLAALLGQARTATLVADPASREILVFSSDIGLFSPRTSASVISLQTKLTYYRNTVHNLRWKLEVYRNQYPAHSYANRHRQIKLYTGPKDTPDELSALYQQARAMAQLLMDWNNQLVESGSDAVNDNLLSSAQTVIRRPLSS